MSQFNKNLIESISETLKLISSNSRGFPFWGPLQGQHNEKQWTILLKKNHEPLV